MIWAVLGGVLAVGPWLVLRGKARLLGWVVLDAAPVVAAFCAALAATGRPGLSGALVGGVLVVLVVVDRAKRAALGEGLVFTDHTLLPLVARHPGLYLPFVPRGVVVAGIGLAVGVYAGLGWFEPARAVPRWALAGVAAGLLLGLRRADWVARASGVVSADRARFGPLGMLAVHRAVAARERPARWAALRPRPPGEGRASGGDRAARASGVSSAVAPHLVLVQCESFCDPRRFAAAPAGLLPHWDRLGGEALARGVLDVPGFGANTMRTEFAVLSGASDAALGLDRLNPYARLARRPVHALPHALAGHEAVALHPFDPRFFRRDLTLPAMGFSRFLAEADFSGAARVGGHVADAALGARIVAMLEGAKGRERPLFLYAITMQAHGPWRGPDPWGRWLAHLADTDAMLGAIAAAAAGLDRPLVLAAFGDHRPALAAARGGRDTDYLVWRSDRPAAGESRHLDAAGLHAAVLAAMLGKAGTIG